MKIALHDMINGGVFWSEIDSFIERTSVSWLAHCMERKWCWDMTGVDGFASDGPCVFIQWGDK